MTDKTEVPQESVRRALNSITLGSLPTHVKVPSYDPKTVSAGILHFGPGNFAFAHLGTYVDDILQHDPTWGIIAVSIRTPNTVRALTKHDCLYAVIEPKNASVRASIVGALFAPDDPDAVVVRLADPKIRLVTLTIKESGYHLKPGGGLNLANPEIVHDLNQAGENPKTVYWYLTQGLLHRMKINVPLTIASMDNLPANTSGLKNGLLAYVAASGNTNLAAWIEANVDFPVTQIDRITPELTAQARQNAADLLDVGCGIVVNTEEFRQFVIEKSRFPMPKWESVGVKTVDDCTPYWRQKFYGLNGAHFLVAVLAHRLGITHIDDAMCNKAIVSLLERFHDELRNVLQGDSEYICTYLAQVRYRFSTMPDAATRVAARGTTKMSERVLAIPASTSNRSVIAFVMAVWLLNLGGKNECGDTIHLEDPQAAKLVELHEEVVRWTQSARPKQSELASLIRHLGEAVSDERFIRMAGVTAFNRDLKWSLLQITKYGAEATIKSFLKKTKIVGSPSKSSEPFKWILCDCDDTLVVSEKLAFDACCTVVNNLLAEKQVSKVFNSSELKAKFVGKVFRRIAEDLAVEFGFEFEEGELETLTAKEQTAVVASLATDVRATDGVDAVLARLDQYQLAVVSSSALARIQACLYKTGLSRFFKAEHLFSAASSLPIPGSKPEPAIYLHALARLGIRADQAIAVEDSRTGTLSAVSAGIRCIGYVGAVHEAEQERRKKELLAAGAAQVIGHWNEFPKCIGLLEEAPPLPKAA